MFRAHGVRCKSCWKVQGSLSRAVLRCLTCHPPQHMRREEGASPAARIAPGTPCTCSASGRRVATTRALAAASAASVASSEWGFHDTGNTPCECEVRGRSVRYKVLCGRGVVWYSLVRVGLP